MNTPTLHAELLAIGAEMENHESDLWVRWTPESDRLVTEHYARLGIRPQSTRHQTDAGAPWIEVPFAFEPWWKARK